MTADNPYGARTVKPSTVGEPVPVRIGYIGDAWSGTLICNVPDCGWEKFVHDHEADAAEAEHRASHAASAPEEAPVADDKSRGLYEKYRVERTDGKTVGPCIVLELDDPNSWEALILWCNTVRRAGYEELGLDVMQQVATRWTAHVKAAGQVAPTSASAQGSGGEG